MRKSTLLLVALFALLISCKTKPKEEATVEPSQPQVYNDFPEMQITLLNGTKREANQLPGKTIIILFFPDCDHCQRESKAIQEKIDAFKDYTLYFLSTNPVEEIQEFANEYKLNSIANVKFGQIAPDRVFVNFGSIPTPSLYIYSAERRLKKQFNGETPVEQIISAL
jgi:cytochrome oxidase Cu insertion factor (SCO1/SenC/PrrC family)